MGSTLVARRAGNRQASREANVMTTAVPATVAVAIRKVDGPNRLGVRQFGLLHGTDYSDGGKGFTGTESITAKMVRLAPRQSASVSTATAVKPGFFSNWRKAFRRPLS
jgi:hypothetical protein